MMLVRHALVVLVCVFSQAAFAENPVDPEFPPGYVAPAKGGMVHVPAGLYPLGDYSGRGAPNEIWVKGATAYIEEFSIDEQLVTNAEYLDFIKETKGDLPTFVYQGIAFLIRPQQPVVGVNLEEARAYCQSKGKRIPTEWEWEVAARAGTTATYPWGNEEPLQGNMARANIGSDKPESRVPSEYSRDGFTFPSPVGAFRAGRNPWDLYDMSGNVWELTQTSYAFWAYRSFKDKQPPPDVPDSAYITVRGGSWVSSSWSARSTARREAPKGGRAMDVGFRCAASAEGSHK